MVDDIQFKKRVGKLIQSYRVRAGISQFDLELATEMASGSISRIEQGKVNPTKETIYKIIDYLELTPIEASRLFGIDIDYFAELLKLANMLQDIDELKELVQTTCDEIVKVLNMPGSTIYMVENGMVKYKNMSMNKFSQLALSLLPFSIDKLNYDLHVEDPNTIVRSIVTGECLISQDLYEFTRPVIPRLIANRIQKVVGIKSFIAIPLKDSEKTIGTMVFATNFSDEFKNELPLLQAFADSIAKIISRHLRLKSN
jgi:transcriptional regulator with XRE-family HTH domain